ncbi:MAG: hypothetical protein FWH01_17745, partial [Oscillospiraceae bacterium]|nr:hypothetical protein [Oscillospiraceae bacterium]
MKKKFKCITAIISIMLAALLVVSCGGAGGGATTAAPAAATTAAATQAAATTTAAAATEAATTAAADTGPQKPVDGKYDPPITLSMFRSVDTNRSYMPGESWDNNLWTVAYEEHLGIKFDYVQTSMPDEYDNTLNIAIASGDIPDYFRCNYDTFYRLSLSGNLTHFSDHIANFGTEAMKVNYEANDGLFVQ